MIIGIDAGCLGVKDERLKVGVFQMAKNLLENLYKIDKKNRYILYSFYPIEREVMGNFGDTMENRILNSKGWLKVQLPFAIFKDKVDIFLGLSQAIPSTLPFSPRPCTIGFVYDLAFEKFPNFYKDSYENLSKNSRFLTEKADKIIAVSNSTKRDIVDYYKVSPSKILVIYQGIGSPPRCAAGATPPRRWDTPPFATPYFLFVGALKSIKNIPTIIKAFERFYKNGHPLTQENSPPRCAAGATPPRRRELYIVGGDKWMDPEISKTLNNIPENVREKIKFLGYIDDKTLINLYKGATAFISPSFYEGFGFTFLEALSCGCPVIGSNAGSIPEVVGNAGLLFDPKDEKGIGEAMIKVVRDKKLRQELIIKGLKQAKKFSSEKFAKKILTLINVHLGGAVKRHLRGG